ncbi:MAG TPA: hypothetical protein VK152_01535 [Paludibacter sp.]|nr:hypothetical protein [Paludibacter sp.]
MNYTLPDIHLLDTSNRQYLIWIPDKPYIVLGASNRAEDALFLENVARDNISVMKRPSGGQTVMLTPNNLVISVIYTNPESVQPKSVFQQVNSLILSVLEQAGVQNLAQDGISDISISGKKILGSSIYRNKNALLYHAVLNMAEPAQTFEKYLKHPSREPGYRKGRKHSEFVTSLRENGFSGSFYYLSAQLSQTFEATFAP